jgi:hypothetical protein
VKTTPSIITDIGDVVGNYLDNATISHGFIARFNTTIQPVDPGTGMTPFSPRIGHFSGHGLARCQPEGGGFS